MNAGAEMTSVACGVPEGWQTSTVGETAEILDSRRVPLNSEDRRTRSGPYPYWGANGIVDYIDDYIFDEPLVLMAEDGGYFDQAATRPICHRLDGPAWVNNHAHIIRPVGVDRDYFYYWFVHRDITPSIKGGTRAKLNQADLKRLPIWLPPLEEQRRIAEVLRSVDEAIAATNATLAATRQIVEKLARDIANGGSDTATIGQFGRVITGGTPSPKQAELWGGDLPFVTPGDLNEEEVSVRNAARTLNVDEAHGARVLPAGSVLVTCIGSTVGKTAIARSSCATNQQINAVCCDPAISGYVYLACVAAYDEIMANAGKQAVPIINKSTFSAIKVPTRGRAEMATISEMVDALDNERNAARSALTALTVTKSALMSDLLSGQVRVPV